MKTKEEIQEVLAYNHGSGQAYRLTAHIVMTEGVKMMADVCEAYWLVDLIVSHVMHSGARIPDYEFQFWRLERHGEGAIVYCGDGRDEDEGGKPEEVMQLIPYTDFPLDEIKIWVKLDGDRFTMLLPSEY
jgi:hypothetical protein